MNEERDRALGAGALALIGALVVLGFCLNDLAVFALSGEPELALELLPACLIFVLGGFLMGALLGVLRSRVPLWVVFLGGALALGISYRIDFGLGEWRILFARAVAAMELVTLLVLLGVERLHLGRLRTALCAGVLTAVGMGYAQPACELRTYLMLGIALVLLGAGWVRSPRPRRLLTSVLLLVSAGLLWMRAVDKSELKRADQPASQASPQGPARDLLLVILDTVRADHLAPYGYQRVTTPGIDGFLEANAERYEWARSASSWTLPSHASLFTGLMPSEHGATHPRGATDEKTVVGAAAKAQSMREDVPTLAEILAAKGYRTGAVIANHHYLGASYGVDRGYEHYDARSGGDVRHYLPLAQMLWHPVRAGRQSYRDAASITDRALDWWQSAADQRPRFLTLNYMDAHSPFFPPPPHDAAFGEPPVLEPTEFHLADRVIQYDRGIHYIDAELSRLLATVDLDKTVVIITSDHGEALGDHGYWMHGWTLFDSITHVPLYVHPVGRKRVALRSEPISGADILQLALHELGLGPPPKAADERPLAEWFQPLEIPKSKILEDKHVARDLLSWSEGTRKWLVSSRGDVRLFDVAVDPAELSPLDLTAAERDQARARATAWWQAHPPIQRSTPEIQSDDVDSLRALGYLGDNE